MEHIENEWLSDDPEIEAIRDELLKLEEQIKSAVNDAAWDVLLRWEEKWAEYTALCVKRLRPVVLRTHAVVLVAERK